MTGLRKWGIGRHDINTIGGVKMGNKGPAGNADLSTPLNLSTVEFDMGTVTNLRVARKRANRQQAAEQAAESRFAHGQPKAKRALGTARRDKADRDLDRHQIDKGEGQ